jgi:hypothetical protein
MHSALVDYRVFVLAAVVAASIVVGCDKGTDDGRSKGDGAQVSAGADALPAGLVLSQAPAGARDVAAVRAEAKVGDPVVLRGRVGGSLSPFVEGRASFQLVDASLKACGEGTAMDNCKTPWDYCCDDPKDVAAHSASIQVSGPDGRPLRAGLNGFAGMKPLSTVTVKGVVAKAASSGALVVNADGIYVGK